MTHVHLTHPQTRLSVRQGRLVAIVDGEAQGEWPLDQLRRVSCHGPIGLSGGAAAALMRADVPVCFLSSRGRFRGTLGGADAAEAVTRMAQYDRWRDLDFRLALARAIVRRKLQAQDRMLATARRPEEVAEGREGLAVALRGLEGATALEALMGYEGAGARAYFGAFKALLLAEVPFEGRTKRPPLDPVNSILSLGYVMVSAELSGALQAEGLDPAIGFVHGVQPGRLSLSLDLVEPLRAPLIDRWALTLFNLRQVQPEDFERRDDGGIYLAPNSFKRVLGLYEGLLGRADQPDSWRHRFTELAAGLRDALIDGIPDLPLAPEAP